ncbi:MAG: hypothetical protein AB7L18_09000, partial [Hyphomicrobiaceae bacterium]
MTSSAYPRGTLGNAIRVGLFIALLGPPIGSLLVSGAFAVPLVGQALGGTLRQPLLSEIASLGALAGIFSYLFGGLHAVLVSLWLGRQTYLRGGFRRSEALMAALAVSMLAGLLFMVAGRRGIVLLQLPAALWAAFATHWLLVRLGWIDPSPP